MYVFMYVCMYVCMHVCMYACMLCYVCMHVCMHVSSIYPKHVVLFVCPRRMKFTWAGMWLLTRITARSRRAWQYENPYQETHFCPFSQSLYHRIIFIMKPGMHAQAQSARISSFGSAATWKAFLMIRIFVRSALRRPGKP